MPVYKIHKTSDYTVMSNAHLRDKRLTLKAKGLLSLMLCLPPTWNHSIAGFTAICKEGRHSISSAFKELEECGYVTVDKKLPEKGSNHISYVYNIFEVPQGFEVSAGQDSGRFSALDYSALKSAAENQAQINTDKKDSLSGFVWSTEDLPVESSTTYNSLVSSGFTPPTLDEVKDFFAGNDLRYCDPEVFFSWHEARSWVVNGSPITNWRMAAQSWNVRERNNRASQRAKEAASKPDYSEFSLDKWKKG